MAANLDDILTAQKNGVIAINSLNSTFQLLSNSLGVIANNFNKTFPKYVSDSYNDTTGTLITTGAGRLFAVSITAYSGSGTIAIYNAESVSAISNSNKIFESAAANSANFQVYYSISMAFSYGIVLVASTNSMYGCVSYNLDEG